MSRGPVESKVKAATLGAAIAGLIIWALETYLFRGAVPVPVQAMIDAGAAALGAYAFGYLARHTPRTDPDALAAQRANPPL